jgi:phosphoribosylformimino-5-aminoimidazole carboxamide ribotide isomerase
MQLIPAIDLKNGRCVRLTEGRAESVKVYDRDPVEVARGYQSAGARLIHVVDLDGAFLHAAAGNREVIRQIAGEVNIPIEVGGGVRCLEDIRTLLSDIGARYVIVGTLAVEQPGVLDQAFAEFGESVIVGIDARGSGSQFAGGQTLRAWTRSSLRGGWQARALGGSFIPTSRATGGSKDRTSK